VSNTLRLRAFWRRSAHLSVIHHILLLTPGVDCVRPRRKLEVVWVIGGENAPVLLVLPMDRLRDVMKPQNLRFTALLPFIPVLQQREQSLQPVHVLVWISETL
jgi:hypothetical protein